MTERKPFATLNPSCPFKIHSISQKCEHFYRLHKETPEHFRPGGLAINHKSAQTSQSFLSVPCKRSFAVPIPFGFQLSVAGSRRCASPVPARSTPCGFVPLRQSRRNTVLSTPSYWDALFLSSAFGSESSGVDGNNFLIRCATNCQRRLTEKNRTEVSFGPVVQFSFSY